MVQSVLHHVDRLVEFVLHEDVHDDHGDDARDAKLNFELLVKDLVNFDLRAQHYVEADCGLEEPDYKHVLEVTLRDLVCPLAHILHAVLLEVTHHPRSANCTFLKPQLFIHHVHPCHSFFMARLRVSFMHLLVVRSRVCFLGLVTVAVVQRFDFHIVR